MSDRSRPSFSMSSQDVENWSLPILFVAGSHGSGIIGHQACPTCNGSGQKLQQAGCASAALKRLLFLTIVICNLLSAWSAVPQAVAGRADFKNLYTAAVILKAGRASELYQHDVQEATQERVYPRPQAVFLPFVQPPYTAILLTPLAAFSPQVAYYLWGWGCWL
jgi:hypothetical protein